MTGEQNGKRKAPTTPVEHLRTFVASVIGPKREAEATVAEPENGEEQKKPFKGRDVKFGSGEDQTLKFTIAAAGGVVILIVLIMGLSHKHQPHPSHPDTPGIGHPQRAPEAPAARPGSIVPGNSMQPIPAQSAKPGKVTAHDLENPSSAPQSSSPSTPKTEPAHPAQTLAKIAPFPSDDWSPPPYSGPIERHEPSDKALNQMLTKPSLLFVANSALAATSSGTSGPLTPVLNLGAGARLSARLNHIVTTAIDLPVVADIEYSYERDGEVIVPAGSQAVGRVQQADRSGYVLIKFDRLEIPGRDAVPIDAVAMTRNLGPIKGKVSGTHSGRNFLVRSFTDIGSGLAMFAGQNNTSGAISENDLLRAQLAQNVGNAGNQEIMQLMMTEHPIVTVSAGTDIFVVFEKTEEKLSTSAPAARPNELRQLLQLERELNQSPTQTVPGPQ